MRTTAAEYLTIWRDLLSGKTVNFEGKHHRVVDSRNYFAPVRRPHPPLYFGGSSPAAHALAAEHVDVYLSWGEPPAAVAEKIADVRRRAAAFGRMVRFGVRLHVIVRETNAEAWADADKLISRLDDATIAKIQQRYASMDSVGQSRMAALTAAGATSSRSARTSGPAWAWFAAAPALRWWAMRTPWRSA